MARPSATTCLVVALLAGTVLGVGETAALVTDWPPLHRAERHLHGLVLAVAILAGVGWLVGRLEEQVAEVFDLGRRCERARRAQAGQSPANLRALPDPPESPDPPEPRLSVRHGRR